MDSDPHQGLCLAGGNVMIAKSRFGIAVGLLFFEVMIGTGRAQAPPPPLPGRESSPPLEGPATGLEPIPAGEARRDGAAASIGEPRGATRDTRQAVEARTRSGRVYSQQQPPAPIVERPAGARPGRRAQWVPGYWDWDLERNDFAWVGGTWQVPPPGSIWVAGRWMRDDDGWYRVPGFWSRRRNLAGTLDINAASIRPVRRANGPPSDHPDDAPAAAPGPDFFFLPGHYSPDGDRLAWTPGFWARIQPGWDWIPARWVRRPDGWEFHEGHWIREAGTAGDSVFTGRRTTARPVLPGFPPGAVEPGNPDRDIDQPPTPEVRRERDPIDLAEEADRARGDFPDFIVVPGGVPVYVIRPPGSFPYGPAGVVVPGAVPPFVRRLLDRVLP